MVDVEVGIRMVAAQLLLMNHFLMSLSHNTDDLSSFQDINSVAVDAGECSYGCTQCSLINGCLACKPPFFLSLQREGIRQTAICTRSCPKGFYKLKKKRHGFCTKCTMRGCVDCLDSRYCSSCDTAYVNFFGKCIKQKSDEGREELGLYPTTRNPGEYYITPATERTIGVNGTSPVSQISDIVYAPPVTQSTTSPSMTSATIATPLPAAATVSDIREDVGLQPETSQSRNRGTSPDVATRFYFTTPTSSLLSESSDSGGISPFPTQTPLRKRVPCRRRGHRRPGRPRGDRKDRKGRKERKKKDRDRKYRRRKGRRGQKNHRKGCQGREKRKKKNTKTWRAPSGGVQTTPPSQDPAIRHLNSAEPREETNENFFLNQNRGSIMEMSNEARPVDSMKTSLLDEKVTSGLDQGGWSKDLPNHFRNRPRAMAAFKRSLAVRKKKKKEMDTEPFFKNGHRIRHGRSRDIPSSTEGIGERSSSRKKPRTRSGRRSRRQGRRRRKRTELFPSSEAV